MGQKELKAYIVLGGRVDSTFSKIGAALSAAGLTIDGVSRKLIDFGKESVNVYRSYEDSMLEAEGALATTYGRGTTELKRVMTQLDAQAAEWAKGSIFHTNDIADAINKAAHADWDLEKILTGLPAAMNLARAGGMDLSEGMDYIIKTTNAAGIEFKDLNSWIDSWAFAANSSAADVRTLGEAMTKMGATMRFADSREELLTMLAVLHDAGTTGSAAGTLLRNSLIRLISPTKKASDIMDELGVSADEVDEALAEVDGDTAGAMKQLEKLGFTVYDSKGNLKSFLEIFTDLNNVTKDLSEQERYKIWSAIFPTRTITGAMALMQAAGDNWDGLMDAFKRGDQLGYASYLSDLMMSGLTGKIELFNSKIEELQRVVGKSLAEQIGPITDNLGKMVDILSNAGANSNVSGGLNIIEKLSGWVGDLADNIGSLDAPTFDGLVAGLGTLATLGPGLTSAGTAIGIIGKVLGGKWTAIILGAVAIVSLAEAIKTYNESEFEDKFGDLELDTTELNAYLGEIQDEFDKTTANVNNFRNALQETYDKYVELSGKFTNTMITDMLTQKPLTEADKEKYIGYGEEMVRLIKQGIGEGTDLSAEFWAALFTPSGGQTPDTSNPAYAAIIGQLNSEKANLLLQAEGIGSDLRDAITKAFEDGQLDDEEYARIKDYYRQLNDIMAQAQREAQSEQDYIKQQSLLHKAQSVSLDSMEAWINESVIPQRDEALQWWEDNYLSNKWSMEFRKERDIEKAKADADAAWAKGEEYDLEAKLTEIESNYDLIFAEAEKQYKTKIDEINATYGRLISELWYNALSESDLGYLFNEMYEMSKSGKNWYDIYNEALGLDQSDKGFFSIFKTSDKTKVGKALGTMIEEMGGESVIKDLITYNRGNGNEKEAGMLDAMLQAYYASQYDDRIEKFIGEELDLTMKGLEGLLGTEFVESALGLFGVSKEEYLQGIMSGAFGFAPHPFIGSDNTPVKPSLTRKEMEALGLISPKKGKETSTSSVEGNVINYTIETNAAEVAEEVPAILQEGADKNPISHTVVPFIGDAVSEALQSMQQSANENPIHWPIRLSFKFSGTNGISSGLAARFGGGDNINPDALLNNAYGDGGRATKPAIYGEAGPEWFIPEAHTPRTGGLLLAAMRASGFDLMELAAMAGGQFFAEGGVYGSSLSWSSLGGGGSGESNSSSAGIQVQYSPVIHADNAAGVERALIDDKARLEKWLNEWWQKRKLYETIASYS